jgi:hypothetical protein
MLRGAGPQGGAYAFGGDVGTAAATTGGATISDPVTVGVTGEGQRGVRG